MRITNHRQFFLSFMISLLLGLVMIGKTSGDDGNSTANDIVENYRTAIRRLKIATAQVEIEGMYSRKIARERSGDALAKSPITEIPQNIQYDSIYSYKSDGVSFLVDYTVEKPDEFFERLTVISPSNEFILRKNIQNGSLYLEKTSVGKAFKRGMNDFKNDIVNKSYTLSGIDVSNILDKKKRRDHKY